jgi:hypothetical protein
MSRRPRERRSRLATWSSRLSLLSVPVLTIASVGHRAGMIDATATYAVIALGFSLAGLAVIAAGVAFAAIWRDGRKGVGAALGGFVIGLAVLSLPAVGAWKIVTLPRLADISTDLDDPPQLAAAAADRLPDDQAITAPSEDNAVLQSSAYPDIVSRHYGVGTARVFEAATAIVAARGWTLLASHEPGLGDDSGRIEAVATTLIFGFRQDVAIRIVPDGDGALVDIRSAARNGAHDLGADADRIRSFFAELDVALEGASGGQ